MGPVVLGLEQFPKSPIYRLHALHIGSLEDVRDSFRTSMSHLPSLRWGEFCPCVDVAENLLMLHTPCICCEIVCSAGHICPQAPNNPPTSLLNRPYGRPPLSTGAWFQSPPRSVYNRCSVCPTQSFRTFTITFPAPIIAFNVESTAVIAIDREFSALVQGI
ncbi:hypothetical protein GYMLUDRAFT_65063 [Collybiopsis luxurians FD-317 M1]|uniref:Uncharacterized protein n=1 Tax=Collybiopsis luxurians FD-317 M1 TaxID=944289 RepID=A0A0D0B9X1_9AGAR|nr:hypothetical protein GYMLUDRAFT_65063 [Collybiopsis luxurians FD-317 M1]